MCTTSLLLNAFVAFSCFLLPDFTQSAFAQDILETALQVSPNLVKLANPVVVTKKTGGPTVLSKPLWKDLPAMQQVSLAPLATNWNTLDEAQKRKWIAIAANYPALAAIEQSKLHARMTQWISLSYQQRAQARLNFAKSKQLTPNEKTASWQAYQALSPEEKLKLATLATPKLAGAAIAAKPVPVQKLTAIPATRPMLLPNKTGVENDTIQRNTLLPQAKASAAQATIKKIDLHPHSSDGN